MKYSVCVNCVMDTSDKDIVFDDVGICNHCYQAWGELAAAQNQREDLPKFIDKIKKSRGKYDCLIGLSGGVDSSLVLHKAVELGLRPLTYSLDNGWNTKESDENIMRLVEGMKVPFFRYVLDLPKFKKLQSAFLQSGTANIEIPTDHILTATAYEVATQYGLKWILSGGNVATESVMPASWGHQPRDLKFIKAVYKKFNKEKMTGLPTLSILKFNYYKWFKGIRIFYLLDYFSYNREEAKKLLAEKYGWKDYGEKHNESVFTTWFQSFYLYDKFGFDKRKAHLSSLINSGQMTRKEALEIIKKPPMYPQFGIERKVLKYPKKDYKDYPNNERLWNFLCALFRLIPKRWRY